MPLYRDAAGQEPNVLPGLLALWGGKLKRDISPEDFAAYLYAILGHGGFVERFWVELEDCQLRVPLTLDTKHFDIAVSLGRQLLFLHTYGERCVPDGKTAGELPNGSARVLNALSEKPADYPEEYGYDEETKTLRVGAGELGPVEPAVWDFEVSGFKVVQSWLGYRMKDRKGKKTSPLDKIHPERWTSEFTDELLRLLSIIERTLAMGEELNALLSAVVKGKLLLATELWAVPVGMRSAPKFGDSPDLPFEEEAEGEDE